jgi:hypothetical protein
MSEIGPERRLLRDSNRSDVEGEPDNARTSQIESSVTPNGHQLASVPPRRVPQSAQNCRAEDEGLAELDFQIRSAIARTTYRFPAKAADRPPLYSKLNGPPR